MNGKINYLKRSVGVVSFILTFSIIFIYILSNGQIDSDFLIQTFLFFGVFLFLSSILTLLFYPIFLIFGVENTGKYIFLTFLVITLLYSIFIVGSKKICTPTTIKGWGNSFDTKIITTGNTESKYELVVGVCNNFLELVSDLYLTTGNINRFPEKMYNLFYIFEVSGVDSELVRGSRDIRKEERKEKKGEGLFDFITKIFENDESEFSNKLREEIDKKSNSLFEKSIDSQLKLKNSDKDKKIYNKEDVRILEDLIENLE